MYVLGVDFGGGSSKATLMNEHGLVVKTATTEYPTDFGEGGRAEQNPMDWFFAAVKNVKEILVGINAEEIACLCFDAATHTAVLLGEDGKPLCPSVYWTDTRCVEEKAYLLNNYGEKIFKKCKHYVDTIWTLPQLLYLKRNRPKEYEKAVRITFAKDFVRGLFTGDFVTDYVEAEGSMAFDFDKRCWDEELLSIVGLDKNKLPKIVSPLDEVGAVRREVCELTGLFEKTKVICGCTDTAMEVVAAGAVNKGDTTIKLATAGRICVVSDGYCPDKNIVNYSHLIDGLYYPGSGTKSCASSLRWFRDNFGGDFAEFSELAKGVDVGSDGLIFHPYLMGELTPYANPKLSGGFTGLSAGHTKVHFVRSVMEGVAMSLLDCKNYLLERGLTISDKAFVIGGGAKSEVWRQIVSDCLNVTLISTKDNDSSFGACMCAGVTAGFFKDLIDASKKCTKIIGVTEPILSNVEKYQKTYKKYKKISAFLVELSNEE